MSYRPVFELNNEMLCLVADIAELAGRVNVSSGLDKNPTLRRENRIKTIHSSLAIEQNTLSLEQVTAVLGGKRVLAPPKDIEEVKNAFEIYELMDTLDPYSQEDMLKAHGVLMRGLVKGASAYRTEPAGIVDSESGKVIHVGTLWQYVPDIMSDLLSWLGNSDVHPLIKGCIFHYELEVIHPFLDGNGRLGRLWHTLIVSKWNALFAFIPVETLIYRNQKAYYDCINACNRKVSANDFIVFMLELLKQALEEIAATCSLGTSQEQVEMLLDYCKEPRTRQEMQAFVGVEGRKAFHNNFLKPLLAAGKLEMTIPDKPNSRNQKYRTVFCK
ncbi:MAG: Fic family protein [Clostridia bacterium]|nr:Fic family protein [Clostridia bacterium]